jgi:hypothetical protein
MATSTPKNIILNSKKNLKSLKEKYIDIFFKVGIIVV